MEAIAKCYAESLFDLALEENNVEGYSKDVELINDVFTSDPNINKFFSHVLIDDDVKLDLLDKSFKNQINSYVLNFLKLLIKKRRIVCFKDIAKAFKALANDYLGIEEGIIYTRYLLDDQEVIKISNALSKKENKKIILKQVLDDSVIGGIRIQIDNHVIDGSIQNKLAALKKELLRK